jgi:hypothetical protein
LTGARINGFNGNPDEKQGDGQIAAAASPTNADELEALGGYGTVWCYGDPVDADLLPSEQQLCDLQQELDKFRPPQT